MTVKHFVFLHGFLGHSNDWDEFKKHLQVDYPNSKFIDYSYFDIFLEANTISQNASLKNEEIFESAKNPPFATSVQDSSIQSPSLLLQNFILFCKSLDLKNCVFIGYSFGARLLLQYIAYKNTMELQNISNALAYILFSAHPGLTQEDERLERWHKDLIWAEKLQNLESKDFFPLWNAQSVFQTRLENASYQHKTLKLVERQQWASLLLMQSLSKQADLSNILLRDDLNILSAVGQADVKFSQILTELIRLNPKNKMIIANSGHRLCFDQSQLCAKLVTSFLQTQTTTKVNS